MAEASYRQIVFRDTGPLQFVVLEMTNINSGDTLDLHVMFATIVGARFFVSMDPTIYSPTVAGTTLTFPTLTAAAGWLAVMGSVAQ